MLPEEQKLNRLESEYAEFEERVITVALSLETNKTVTAKFQRRYILSTNAS